MTRAQWCLACVSMGAHVCLYVSVSLVSRRLRADLAPWEAGQASGTQPSVGQSWGGWWHEVTKEGRGQWPCPYRLLPRACGAGLGQCLAGCSPDPPRRHSRECVQTGERELLVWVRMFQVLIGAWVAQVQTVQMQDLCLCM